MAQEVSSDLAHAGSTRQEVSLKELGVAAHPPLSCSPTKWS